MKKTFLPLVALSLLVACGENKGSNDANAEKAVADSLFKVVMHGHDVGMAKDRQIKEAIAATTAAIDSVGKLPTNDATNSYKASLDTVLSELNAADSNMSVWMKEMKWEIDKVNLEDRVGYLQAEVQKVDKVKEDILNSLQKAEAVLNRKF